MQELRKCNRCGYQIDESVRKCPMCGTRILSASYIRGLGVAQVVLGLFIVGLMGTVTIFLAPMMFGTQSGFTGTKTQAGMIMFLFAIVIVFGLTSVANGVFQIATGRRNKWIMIITFVLLFILIVVVFAVQQALSG